MFRNLFRLQHAFLYMTSHYRTHINHDMIYVCCIKYCHGNASKTCFYHYLHHVICALTFEYFTGFKYHRISCALLKLNRSDFKMSDVKEVWSKSKHPAIDLPQRICRVLLDLSIIHVCFFLFFFRSADSSIGVCSIVVPEILFVIYKTCILSA